MKKIFPVFLSALLCGLALMLCGCDSGNDTSKLPIERIKILQGDNQTTLPGEAFEKALRFELLGPQKRGLLGGKGEPTPLPQRNIRVVPTEGSQLFPDTEVAVTDAAGMVQLKLGAGKKLGDHYLELIPEDAPEKKVVLRYSVGAKLAGGDQETAAGTIAREKVSVTIVDSNGKPAKNVPVYFSFGTTPEGTNSKASLSPEIAHTNAEGVAETRVKLGKASGTYLVNVEVADPEQGIFMRAQQLELYSFNLWTVLFSVLGGLALFVFGMQLMGDGLQKIAGENMRKILQFFSRNGVVAVLAGTVVTAIIQSSSATTVMVIGFINAGMLSLAQAIGIIFGANIGTTVTAQIISFNLSGLAMPAIILGFLMTISKKESVRGWGETTLGFGLLFFGMSCMSNELKMLGDFPTFANFFQIFNCAPKAVGEFMPLGAVLGAIIIGIVATVIIQSSSAAMGIVLALAGGGLINFYTAVPLLLGTNIGTTITAILAAIAANRVAKQAALAHTLFNVLGTAIMIALFYVPYGEQQIPVFLYFINSITPGDVFSPMQTGIERHIAMAHTFFNVVVTLFLMPFISLLAKLCERVIPADKQVEYSILEPHLLATPSAALEQSVDAIRQMVKDSWSMVDLAVNRHFLQENVNEAEFKELAQAEEKIDDMQHQVTNYLVRITRRRLTRPQSELVPLLMHCTNDAERIADHTANILILTRRLEKLEKPLSEQAQEDLKQIWDLLNEEANNVIDALGSDNPEKINRALQSEQKINKLTEKYENAHIDRLREGSCSLVLSVIFIEMLGEMEKLGDHLSNIAERTPEIQKHYLQL